MRSMAFVFVSVVLVASIWIVGGTPGMAQNPRANVVDMLDNCDPADPGYDPTGGCALKPKDGDVSFNEFFELLFTPLDPAGDNIVIGHPSWRNDPSYLSTEENRRVRIRNRGGRAHSFTEVENFGGGFVPDLNGGLLVAPECDPQTVELVAPGDGTTIRGLAPGLHKFQCCIHPWMRAAIRVE